MDKSISLRPNAFRMAKTQFNHPLNIEFEEHQKYSVCLLLIKTCAVIKTNTVLISHSLFSYTLSATHIKMST